MDEKRKSVDWIAIVVLIATIAVVPLTGIGPIELLLGALILLMVTGGINWPRR